jgi:hemoglobin
MSRLKGRQVEFFAAALGGPHPYNGLSMADAHRGRGIALGDFELVAAYLTESLSGAGLDEATVGEIIGLIAPLAGDIVSGAA